MSTFPAFEGFPQEGLDFLAGLAQNNNRDWFNARKAVYQEKLLPTAQAFVVALGERFKALCESIQYDPSTAGSGSVMRIYRDTRFSQDKTPYHDYLRFIFWEGEASKKTDNPGLYFTISPRGGGLWVGLHGFTKPMLQAYREAVADDVLGPALVAALDSVQGAGAYEVGGEQYARVPAGYAADHPRADLLRYKGLYAASPRLELELLTQPGLVDAVSAHAEKMLPLHRWLVQAAARQRA